MADEAWYEKAWDRMDNEDYVQAIVFLRTSGTGTCSANNSQTPELYKGNSKVH
jgi:hypothetical protein